MKSLPIAFNKLPSLRVIRHTISASCDNRCPLRPNWPHAYIDCSKWEATMSRMILASLITSFTIGSAMAQSCESQAVSKEGKPLHGAAKTSFVNKCKRQACEGKAVSKEGKPLHGAAKNSFMAKCKRSA